MRFRGKVWTASAFGLAASLLGWAALVATAAAQPAPRGRDKVDLQLVLAVDASGSVNDERFALQQKGYAEAFRHKQVLQAIRSGHHGAIAVIMVQWTGPRLQRIAAPWTRISDGASAEDFAAVIEQAPRMLFGGGTSISGAIDFAAGLFATSPFAGDRHVIDISGDGINNRGRPTVFARDEAVAAGIVINGLPILALEPGLDSYYRQSVIGGPGAFVVVAESYDTFGEAIRRKLVLEIARKDRTFEASDGTPRPPRHLSPYASFRPGP